MRLRELLKKALNPEEETLQDFKRGKEAELLLQNPAFLRAFDSLEDTLDQGIASSDWDQQEARESAYNRLKAAQWLKNALLREIDDGKLAQKRLNK